MSLDIRIQTSKRRTQTDLAISLNDDGYYSFLRPLFERLREECGKTIDPYADATFTRDDFPRLRRLLDEAVVTAGQQPKAWKVHAGTQVRPTRKELYQTLQRDDLIKIISTLRNMVDVADELGGVLECIGD